MRQGFYPVCHLRGCLHMLENMRCTESTLAEHRHTVSFQRNGRAKRNPLTGLISESPSFHQDSLWSIVAKQYVYLEHMIK